jgi:hypothetical protein
MTRSLQKSRDSLNSNKMAPCAYVLQNILPHDALKLGWLVLSTSDPLKSYFQTSDPLMPVIEHEFQNVAALHSQRKTTSFVGFLSGVLKTGLRLRKGVSINIEAASYHVSRLSSADEWFENTLISETLRRWFEEKIERHGWRLRIYLVVGLHVARNVQLSVSRTNGFEIPIQTPAPLSAMLGDPGILATVLSSPSATMDYSNLEQSSASFETKDIIYAVHYRPVKINWLTGKDKPYLSRKTCWKVMATDAGAEEEEEEVVDVILEHEDDDDHDEARVNIAFQVADIREEFCDE